MVKKFMSNNHQLKQKTKKMKKEYLMPLCEVITVPVENLLEETSTIEVPGGGHGEPDDSRCYDSTWDD